MFTAWVAACRDLQSRVAIPAFALSTQYTEKHFLKQGTSEELGQTLDSTQLVYAKGYTPKMFKNIDFLQTWAHGIASMCRHVCLLSNSIVKTVFYLKERNL